MGMYAYLKSKELVNRMVVICPKNAFGSWIDEFEFCFVGKDGLRCFNLHSPIYKSTTKRKSAVKFESGKCNLLLFNYESVGTYRAEIQTLIEPNTLLVFDEVHRVKRVEGEYAINSVAIDHNATYVVTMTGTLIPNSYMDIYNLLHILFPDEYNEFFNFPIGILRSPSSEEIAGINAKLQPF